MTGAATTMADLAARMNDPGAIENLPQIVDQPPAQTSIADQAEIGGMPAEIARLYQYFDDPAREITAYLRNRYPLRRKMQISRSDAQSEFLTNLESGAPYSNKTRSAASVMTAYLKGHPRSRPKTIGAEIL